MTNSSRVEHNIFSGNNIFRDDKLKQIMNDIDELLSGKGYIEYSRTGVFIDGAIVWADNSKQVKRFEIVLDRTQAPPFIGSVLFKVYDQDGVNVVSEVTETVNRNSAKQILNTTTTSTRP